MDDKERQIIQRYRDKLSSSTFDELDVYGLLIALRPYAPDRSPIYECANFVAHRERDRGLMWEYLVHVRTGLTKPAPIVSKVVFTEQEFGKSLNGTFKKLGIGTLSPEIVVVALLCIISLLQHVLIVAEDQSTIGELVVGYSEGGIGLDLLAIMGPQGAPVYYGFNALRVRHPSIVSADTTREPRFLSDSTVSVSISGGKLTIQGL